MNLPIVLAATLEPDPVQPPGFGNAQTMLNWVNWVCLAIVVAGVLMIGAQLAISHRRGEGGDHVGKLGYAGGGVILIGAAGSVVGALA